VPVATRLQATWPVIATRYEGLQLEERMLYPKDVKSKVTVTLPSGETLAGTLAYLDEFTIGMRDASGSYTPGGWRREVQGGRTRGSTRAQFPNTAMRYHNLMAYIQTLR